MNIAETLTESLSIGLSERGNNSLYNQETSSCMFYHEVAEGVWLEIIHMAENYPAWSVQTVNKSKDEIVKHIEENFSHPWIMQKNNIGVNCDSFESPLTMEEVLEELETELYRKERMTDLATITQALQDILKEHIWTIRPAEHDKIVNEYYNTL